MDSYSFHTQGLSASVAYKSSYAMSHNADGNEHLHVSKQAIRVNLSEQHPAERVYFLRMLKKASQQNRWIMFIGDDALPDKESLIQAGIDISKILVLTRKPTLTQQELLEKALTSSNCSAVITVGHYPDFMTPEINNAIVKGKCDAYIIDNNLNNNGKLH